MSDGRIMKCSAGDERSKLVKKKSWEKDDVYLIRVLFSRRVAGRNS